MDRQVDRQIYGWMDSEEIGRKDEDREKSRQGEETAILFNHEREKLRGHRAKLYQLESKNIFFPKVITRTII